VLGKLEPASDVNRPSTDLAPWNASTGLTEDVHASHVTGSYVAVTVSLWTSTPFTRMETVHTPGVDDSCLFQSQ